MSQVRKKKNQTIKSLLAARRRELRKPYSFRLPEDLMKKFQSEIDRINRTIPSGETNINCTEMLEKLIREFVSED